MALSELEGQQKPHFLTCINENSFFADEGGLVRLTWRPTHFWLIKIIRLVNLFHTKYLASLPFWWYLNFYREAHLNFFVWFRTSSIKYVILKSLYRISVSLLAQNQMVKNCFWAVKKYFRASINSNRLVCHCHGFIYRNMLYILFRRINWIRLSQLLYRYSTTSFVTDYKLIWPHLTLYLFG